MPTSAPPVLVPLDPQAAAPGTTPDNVPRTAEVKVRRDYYQLDFPIRTRAQEFGVYAEEVLAVYAPFAMGVITNIANG
jgi:hypothetical protein